MAEATGIKEAQPLKPGSAVEKDLLNLEVLSWLSSNPQRRPKWLKDNHPTTYWEVRQLLSGVDWRNALPMAIQQSKKFKIESSKSQRLTKDQMEAKRKTTKSDFLATFKAAGARMTGDDQTLSNPYATFGNDQDARELIRLYINPKIDRLSYKKTVDTLAEIFKTKNINGQIKGNLEDLFEKMPDGTFISGPSENKLVIYLDAKDGKNITNLLNSLADSSILQHLEGSGDWAFSARIPVANGISFVEARGISWDAQDSKDLGVVKYTMRRIHWENKTFPQVIQEIMFWPKGTDLFNIGVDRSNDSYPVPARNPQMPGLLLQSPVQKP